MLRLLVVGLASLLLAGPAAAQAPVCFKTSSSQIGCTPVTTTTSPLPVTASGTVTVPSTVQISDGTTGPVAVKAASTAPVAADKSLVVAISPNSVNANGQATMANSSPVVISSNQSNVPVVNGGSAYETVAASQTGQALGATGAIGDYLSHCVIYPTSTTPGVVTVFDNTNAAGTNAIAFPGGASSVSSLVPIAIPVGAISTAGAWKVTTGANLVVTCYGKFT